MQPLEGLLFALLANLALDARSEELQDLGHARHVGDAMHLHGAEDHVRVAKPMERTGGNRGGSTATRYFQREILIAIDGVACLGRLSDAER